MQCVRIVEPALVGVCGGRSDLPYCSGAAIAGQ